MYRTTVVTISADKKPMRYKNLSGQFCPWWNNWNQKIPILRIKILIISGAAILLCLSYCKVLGLLDSEIDATCLCPWNCQTTWRCCIFCFARSRWRDSAVIFLVWSLWIIVTYKHRKRRIKQHNANKLARISVFFSFLQELRRIGGEVWNWRGKGFRAKSFHYLVRNSNNVISLPLIPSVIKLSSAH